MVETLWKLPMSFSVIALIFCFLTAFSITYFITPFLIERMKKRGITGIDLNKLSRPQVPEMGGISVFFGFAFGVLFALLFFGYFHKEELEISYLFAAFITVLIVGFIGVFDDLIGWKNGIRKWQHALLPVFAALPLMVVPQAIETSTIYIPFFGEVYVGALYSIALVPLAVTGASNAVNMLAGMNGLESGLGITVSLALLAAVFFLPGGTARYEAAILLVAMLGSLFAFLRFNWFPAKIFGGDSLTLMIGAVIASASIIGKVEWIGFLLFALYFVELALKSKHRMQSECFGIPQKDGTLKPRPQGGSITQWIMKMGKFTEPKVVKIIIGIQILVSLLVLYIAFFDSLKWF